MSTRDYIEVFLLTTDSLTIILICLVFFIIYFLFFTVLLIALSFKVFEKAGEKPEKAFIPIYNILLLFKLTEIPSYYFFTLLVPGLNILLMSYCFYRLGKKFEMPASFLWGLTLCPIVFLPMLSYGKYNVKPPEEEVFISVSDEMPSVLTQEQLDELNKIEAMEPKVDNVFKSNIKQKEVAPTYKAEKVVVNESFIKEDAPAPEQIKRIEPIKAVDITPKEKEVKPKFIEEEIEIVDLSTPDEVNETTGAVENEVMEIVEL